MVGMPRKPAKPPQATDNPPSASSGLVPASKIVLLLGCTDRRLRQLASEGRFPPPVRGEYLVFGRNMADPPEQERVNFHQRIGMVFNGGRLLQRLTVAENVALPLRYHHNLRLDEVSEQVQHLVELTGLAKFADRIAGAIGRNWQQRAGLARALAPNPEVLLLDNALTGLDPRDAFWWLEFLDRLGRGDALPGQKPMTLVASADDLRPWRERAKQFALLKEGRLLVLGDQQRLSGHAEPLLRDLLPAFARPI